MKKEIQALEKKVNMIDNFIVENYEKKLSIHELATCKDKAFIKACREYDKYKKALITLKSWGY